jgi:hypothetical protein
MTSRYVPFGIQAEYEPGSRGRVLRNLLGITRVGDIGEAESQTLLLAQVQAIERYGEDQRFSAQDICDLHRLWLSPVYAWAGEYRSVNMGKAGFQFAHAPLIAGLMAQLERGALSEYTPLSSGNGCDCSKGSGSSACRADIDSPIQRRQWPSSPAASSADGFSSRLAAAGLFTH